jgi:hypothetical protein
MEGWLFYNHTQWCKWNTSRSEEEKQRTKTEAVARQKTYLDKKLGHIKIFTVLCHKCGGDFEVQEREFQHPKKSKYYCGISCRNSRPRTEEERKKVSETLKARYGSGELTSPLGKRKLTQQEIEDKIPVVPRRKVQRICAGCGGVFCTIRPNPMFCTRECRRQHDRKNLSDLALYKAECRFQFSIKDFPEEFDFDLIREHGWYKAANHGNNLGGVSRDHMISVRWGFDHGILPILLRHPANCKLLVHSDNISKHKKCSLTVEELLDRIDAWDQAYGRRKY